MRRLHLGLLVVTLFALSSGCKSKPYCLTCGDGGTDRDGGGLLDFAGTDFLVPPQTDGGGDAGGGICVPSNGGVETCDHLDNNCNGLIDDVSAAALTADPNNCGACFRVCDFTALHQFGACTTAAGVSSCQPSGCLPGFYDLDANPANGCEYACTPTIPPTESCDGLDNDCNGLTDDGLTLPASFCSTLGVCAGKSIPISCAGAAGWKCDYSAVPFINRDLNGNLAVLETSCDSRDNNCNGVVDKDGYPALGNACTAGIGVCQNAGTVVCTSPTTAGCSATPTPGRAGNELCNGKDDNCNGVVDESYDWIDPATSTKYLGWKDPMVAVPRPGGGTVYVYQFEASHPDATATSPGGDLTRACANQSVLPWSNVSAVQAQTACAAVKDSTGAPLRLCTAGEWQKGCEGPTGAAPTKYSVSKNPTSYVAQICNDANQSATPAPWATGSNGAQSVALGEFCYANWAAAGKLFDMSGNLKEWTASSVTLSGKTYNKIRGGAFSSPAGGTTCEFDFDIAQPSFANSDLGFRCCADNPTCGNVASDPNNCGQCGVVCPGVQVCSAGTCQATCAGGLAPCNRACLDLTTDAANCAACGAACAPGQSCVASACACPASTQLCSGQCVNIQSDPANCGLCGKICGFGEVCSGGACLASCGSTLVACGASCVNPLTDPNNCGTCGIRCATGGTCIAGSCCAPGAACGGVCVDRQTDNNNCGACGTKCAGGSTCQAGLCCAAGLTNCNGVCVNLQTNNNFCGACGTSCALGSTCQSGSCCATGSLVCSLMCVDPQTDPSNCGGCGIICPSGKSCTAGSCCPTGQISCGGTCIDPKTNNTNCGTCGTTCAAGLFCTNGTCQCPVYQSLCGGVCIPTSIDPNNCGGCGVVCGVGTTCSAGKCVASCLPGLTACGRSCVDLKTDNAHCGACPTACTGANTGCTLGTCGPAVVPAPPAKCVNGGPPIIFSDGTTQTCAGGLAQITFRWGLCSCKDVGGGGTLLTDAYDSSAGPYVPGGLGGGVGLNGTYSASGTVNIFGTLWSVGPIATGATTVKQELHAGATLVANGPTSVGLDAFDVGNVTGNNKLTISGKLFTPAATTVTGTTVTGGIVRQPVTVPAACDCSPAQLVPVVPYVTFRKTTNDNALIGLNPAMFTTAANPPSRLDLPCGNYYLDGITNVNPAGIVIAAHGRTALYIGGSINIQKISRFVLDPGSEFDILVAGGILTQDDFHVGSPNYPAASRTYVGSTTNPLNISGQADLAGNVYAAAAPVTFPSGVEVYGAVYAGDYTSSSNVSIHYDRNVLRAGDLCPPPPPGGCTSCRDCGNQACVAGTCGACTSSAQCCAPLSCILGRCVILN